jgi:hypothetical protein
MRLISAGSLVRAQSGPPERVKVKGKKAKGLNLHTPDTPYPPDTGKRHSKIEKLISLHMAAHKAGTYGNLHRKEASEYEVLTSNCPAQQFFENYR